MNETKYTIDEANRGHAVATEGGTGEPKIRPLSVGKLTRMIRQFKARHVLKYNREEWKKLLEVGDPKDEKGEALRLLLTQLIHLSDGQLTLLRSRF